MSRLTEKGSALVVSVLVLLVLTVIGIYAVTTSTMETKISGFERTYKVAFYTADSGLPVGVEVTKYIIHHVPSGIDELPSPWNSVVDSSLIDEVFSETPSSDDFNNAPDINSQNDTDNLGFLSATTLKMDVDRLAAHYLAGGAIEFGAGYEGIGKGAAGGGVGILFGYDSLGQYAVGASSEVYSGYRHVVGVPGG